MTRSFPGRWLVLRVPRPDDENQAALLTELLLETGGRAVLEEEGELVTHVPEPADPAAFIADLRTTLERGISGTDEGVPAELRTDWQAQEDWAELWKRGLEPRRITDRLVVTPSWCSFEPRPTDLVVTVDPGMAFGNAEHGTTRGCLRLLDGLVREGDHILDVGAGSAILAIAAALLGATDVLAVEADPLAVPTARENVEANGVADRVQVRELDVDVAWLQAVGAWNGVMANIETGILRALLPGLTMATAPAGWLLLSGIPVEEWDGMAEDVAAAGLTGVASDIDGEWRSGIFRRRRPSE